MKTRHHAAPGLAAVGFAALPLVVHAQTNTSDQASAPVELNPMVVTAALAPRTADQSLSSVTVIDEAALRRQDPASVTDVLRGQPGVDVTTSGSFGKQSSVFLRGAGSNANVLLIDGIRLRSATTGAAAWTFLDPRIFESAEIVRGPRGSLYGADAVGGVIQLFTPEEGEGDPTPSISAGGGSFEPQRYSASLSGAEGGTRYHVAASRFETEGGPVRRGGDDKGYDNTTGLVRLSHTFDSGAEVGMLALRAKGNTEFDAGSAPGDTDYVQQVAGVYGELPISTAWRSRLTLSEARDESDTYVYNSVIDTKTNTVRWDNTFYSGAHELILGAEYVEDSIAGSKTSAFLPPSFEETTEKYDEESRYNAAVFAQGLLDFSPFSLQASLRHDDNEAYGEELTGSLALGYELDGRHILRASYGTAFRAPTFNDLYYPGSGNPDLEAETSETFELGIRGQHDRWFWDAAIYQTDIDNLISGQTLRENIPTSRIRGAELSSGFDIEGWVLSTALTYTDPKDRSTGERLRSRAKKSLRFDIDRSISDFNVGASWLAQSDRIVGFNRERVSGYGIVDLRAGWDFAPMWSARLNVDNFLDKEYATAKFFDGDDYINAGRAAFVSVHFGP